MYFIFIIMLLNRHRECVCRLYLVFTAGEGIITYCVTSYPVAFCLIKEIEEQLWRLQHYLLCHVTETSLI